MVHSITLATGDSEIATNDVLGRLNYAAPGEAQADDARLIGASITAVAEGAFTTSANATKLVFSTGASETAAEKMSLSSAGVLTLSSGGLVIPDGGNIGTTDADAIAIASDGVVTMNQIPVFSAGINVSGGTIAGTIATVTQNSITTMTGLVTVGTIGTGVWNGTAIATTYIADNAITGAKIALGSDTTGDIMYYNGTNYVRLAAAQDGYILTATGAGAAPAWEAAAGGGGTPTDITVADESSDTTCFPLFVTAATGDLGPKTGSNLAFNSSSGALTATTFVGNIDAVDGDFDGTLEADAITLGGTALGSLYSVIAGSSSIVTTGALDSGSITSGFGTIDTGSSTLGCGAITTTGDVIIGGATPTLTIGDAGAEDTSLVFDGNAQDFYVGLDDTDDDLKIGLGSAVGTTPVITMTGAGAVNFGVDDTGYDVKMYGATASSYLQWDESLDRLNLVAGSFRIEQVPASNAGTTVTGDSGATINVDWSRGNYHWIVLGAANVTKIIFQNMKRGGRYVLRIEQGGTPRTVAWTNVDSDESDAAFTEVRWVGGTAPTMSTTAARVDVYGFLCTRSNGRGVDAFVIAQDLQEDGTH
jgi:hypothetical protein